jgi:hypothetical protein
MTAALISVSLPVGRPGARRFADDADAELGGFLGPWAAIAINPS